MNKCSVSGFTAAFASSSEGYQFKANKTVQPMP